jgi:hypothetical protein
MLSLVKKYCKCKKNESKLALRQIKLLIIIVKKLINYLLMIYARN